MTLQALPIAELVRRLKKAEENVVYVTCPSCGTEWTKLRPCSYWWTDKTGRHDDVSSVCVECAETLKGFEWIMHTWPLQAPGSTWTDWLKIDHFWPDGAIRADEVEAIKVDEKTGEIRRYKEKMYRWGLLRVRVRAWIGQRDDNAPAVDLILHCSVSGTHIATFESGVETPIQFDNALAAWMWVKYRVLSVVQEPPSLPEAEKRKFKRT